MTKIIISDINEIDDFYSEIERGCLYSARSRIPHNAGHAGMIEAPFREERAKGVIFYHVIPIHAIKKDTFKIRKGEIGDLVDVGFSDEVISFARVVWKRAIQIYYASDIEIGDSSHESLSKKIRLEDLFEVIKTEQDKKRE